MTARFPSSRENGERNLARHSPTRRATMRACARNASSVMMSSTSSSSSTARARGRASVTARGRANVTASASSSSDDVSASSSANEDAGERASVAVVSTSSCPHCKRAKSALDGAGIAYEVIDVDDAAALRADELRARGLSVRPAGVRRGEIYGGADDTCEGLDAGDFEAKARRAASEGIPGAPAKPRRGGRVGGGRRGARGGQGERAERWIVVVVDEINERERVDVDDGGGDGARDGG